MPSNPHNSWVSVKEQMPDDDLVVMIFSPRESEPVWLGYFDGIEWRAVDAPAIKVTHWRHLPDPPARK